MIFEIYGDKYYWSKPKSPVLVYIRYGLWAGMKKSTNHSTREDEKGISVYRAILDNREVKLAEDEIPCSSLEGQGRLCFAVTGKEVGIGSDGEPVLIGVKIVPYALHRSVAIY